MTRPRRLGIDVSVLDSIRQRVERAVWAEKVGYQDCWIAEISDPDPFVTMGMIGDATSRIRLGTAIVPMGSRSVPALASAAASVAEVSGGRFALGLGVSSEVIIQQWHGVERGKPLGRARETVELLRHLLAGGRSAHHGAWVQSKGFRLRHPPSKPPVLLLAAMNQRMLELAGEIADGVLLNFVPLSAVETVLDAVHRGADRAGREELPEVILPVVVDVTDDEEASVARFARELSFYLSAPPYQRALTSYGFKEEVERGRQRWSEGKIDHVAAGVSEEFVRAIGIIGSCDACRQRIEDYWGAGVDTISLGTQMGVDPTQSLDAFATLAQEVKPADG